MGDHAALVALAVRWLKKTRRCPIVLQEPPAMVGESPDAIGWKSAFSVMVECKVSRADFAADQKKAGRVTGRRLAHRCYYLTPAGLVKPDDVPQKWGLLETADGRTVRIVRDIPEPLRSVDDRTGAELRDELYLLYCELRRFHAQGITYHTLNGRVSQAHVLDLEPADGDVRDARLLMRLEGRA